MRFPRRQRGIFRIFGKCLAVFNIFIFSAYNFLPGLWAYAIEYPYFFHLAAPQLLQRFLPDLSPQATALSLAQISRLPLCLNLPGSTLSEVLARCAAQHNIRLQCGVSTSDYGVQLALCLAGECGFFCPASLLQPVEAARSLRIFTVPELQEQLHIECIRTAAAVQPAYIRAFESALLQVCRSLTL